MTNQPGWKILLLQSRAMRFKDFQINSEILETNEKLRVQMKMLL